MFTKTKTQLKYAYSALTKTTKVACTTMLIAAIAFGGSSMLRAFAEPTPSVETSMRVVSTGIAPFDATTFDPASATNAGTDANTSNNVVRMGDYITYRVDVNLNGKDTTNLVSAVLLDAEADFTTLPDVCLTVGVSPISSISADKKYLTCNLAASVVQGTKISYDVIVQSNVNGQNATLASQSAYNTAACNLDKGCIHAINAAIADNISTSQTGNFVTTLLTTKFAVDLSKVLPGENPTATPPTSYTPIYNKPNAAATANGHVLQYTIAANALAGSEKIQGDASGKVSFVLTDTFSTTDPVGNVNGSMLYNWDPATTATGCDKIGTSIGSLTCTQTAPGGPITITVTDVDTNYPDGIGKLFGITMSVWVPITDIATSQDCVANPSSCNISVRNVITGLDYPTSAPYSNAAGATTGNRLKSVTGIPNFGGVTGVDEPVANNRVDHALNKTSGGASIGIVKTMFSNDKTQENTGKKQVSKGEIVPVSLITTAVNLGQYGFSQCDKIDTNNFEFYNLPSSTQSASNQFFSGIVQPNFGTGVSIYNTGYDKYLSSFDNSFGAGNNTFGFVDLYNATTNANGQLKIEYATSPNGNGSPLDQSTAQCLNSDTWYSDISSVPTGATSITKVRWVVSNWQKWTDNIIAKTSNTFSQSPAFLYMNYNLKVKQTATGYGVNKWLPSYTTAYTNVISDFGLGSDGNGMYKYTALSTAQTDPTDPNFAIKAAFGSADRVVLVDNTMAIAKDTVPAGKIQTAPGAIEEYLISPSLFGAVVGTPTDLFITDTLPSYADYVPGSLVVNTPGDLTTGTPNLVPAISGSNISWNITGITKTASGTGSNMPTFRFKVKFRSETPTGDYLNTVKMTSSDAVLNATALPSGEVSAAKSLKIVAPDGYRVTKTENRDIYEVNEKIAFDLNYSRTGGSVYNPGDFIDVLPYNGDALDSSFVNREDTLTPSATTASVYTDTSSNGSVGLAAVPTGTNGETFKYTTAAPATISNDPCHSANQPAGFAPTVTTDPCYLEYTLNGNKFVDGVATGSGLITWTATAPALDTVTAIRWASTKHNPGEPTRSINVQIQPKGDKQGDIFCNSFSGRIPEISLAITSNDVCAKIVSGTISGSIWKDANNNGTATNTETEAAIATATVSLLYKNAAGAFVPYLDAAGVAVTTTTNTAGFYEFKELPSGTFQTAVTYLASYGKQTYDLDDGSNPATFTTANNSGDIILTGPALNVNTSGIPVGQAGTTAPTYTDVADKPLVNYSYNPPATISGFEYVDANNDGIKQATETAIAGVTVTLTKTDGTPVLDINGVTITPATTDALGAYSFANLPAGSYIVTATQPAAYNDGKDTASDSVLVAPTGTTAQDDKVTAIVIAGGEVSANNNFGEIIKPATISGFEYVDANNDGIKQATETAIAGVTVTLTKTDGTPVLDINGVTITPATTDALGAYSFANLPAGSYIVTATQPAAYNDGKDTASDSVLVAPTGTTAQDDKVTAIVIAGGEVSANNNFGEMVSVTSATITGSVYLDPNNDGTQSISTEPNGNIPVGTVVVITSTTDATITYTAVINPDGTYSQVVPAGTYTVTLTASAAYTIPTSTELGDGTGANPTTVTVLAGETKSQGKDGLYLSPVSSSSSSATVSSSSVSSSSMSSSSATTTSSSVSQSSSSTSSATTTSSSSASSTPASSSSSSMSSSSTSVSSSSASQSSSSATTSSSSSSVVAISSSATISSTPMATSSATVSSTNTGPVLPPILTSSSSSSTTNPVVSFLNNAINIIKSPFQSATSSSSSSNTTTNNGAGTGAGTTNPTNNQNNNPTNQTTATTENTTTNNNQNSNQNNNPGTPSIKVMNSEKTGTLDLNDPYNCGSDVYGFVASNPKIIADIKLEFSQNGKVVKTYTLKTDSDGNWKQFLFGNKDVSSDLPFGFYNYKVIASYGNLSDSESFDIDHLAPEDCPKEKETSKTTATANQYQVSMNGKPSATTRTGGSDNLSFSILNLVIGLSLASALTLKLASKRD
jgi:hypothetical protein